MQNHAIPEGLELVTDPYINKLFPSKYIKPCLTKSDYTSQFEAYLDGCDCLEKYEKMNKAKQLENTTPSTSWGNQRIKRFIARYVSIYKKRNMPDREFFLEQLQGVAKENNVKLPTHEEIYAASDKCQRERLICGMVDLNTENRVSDYKYYFDGSRVVAYLVGENKAKNREIYERTKWDSLFEKLYPMVKSQYSENNKTKSEVELIRMRIESDLIVQFYNLYGYDDAEEKETCPEFIARKLYNMTAAYSARKRRFYRKKNQVRWTAWWTITYDEAKFNDEAQFRRVLLNYFRNKSVRNGWLVMGVFEHGEDNGRLHFHGFFYIPEGKNVGQLVEVERFSTKRQCMEKYIENTELREKFGINKYEDISEALKSDVNAMARYTGKMLGYMEKGETVFYSRHIPMEFLGKFNSHDMLLYYCITCKRPIKRYVINPHLLTRTDLNIYRTKQLKHKSVVKEVKNESDPYDIGLLDIAG